MVNEEEFMECLNRGRLKFTHEKVKSTYSKWNKVVQYHFIDSDEYWHFKLVNGVPGELINDKIDNPDIFYEMSKETLIAIDKKELSGMKAYKQKLVKIKAKMPDLMKLQKLDKI